MDLNSQNSADNFTDDTYWISSHQGFDFNTFFDGTPSTVSPDDGESTRRTRLQESRFTEVIENPFYEPSLLDDEVSTTKMAKTFNPLIINQKRASVRIRSEPQKTVANMIMGFEYSLTGFKGKLEKEALLLEAVKSHDGNAILEVILFLRDTLKKSTFQREILAHPDAVNVYLAYLEEAHDMEEFTNMLLLTNRAEDAAMWRYENAVSVQHPRRRLEVIENCLDTHFQLGMTEELLRQSVEEHKQVLEEQIKMVARLPDENQRLQFESLTGKKSVIDSSVICSLLYCFVCAGEFRTDLPKPEAIKANYNLSKKQFMWAALRALAVSERWSELGGLLMRRSWRGNTKLCSCIPCDKILDVLSKANAPETVLEKYVLCAEDEGERLVLAHKYACHAVVIEGFKNNNDRLGLIQYQASLPQHSVDFYTALEILSDPAIRWKN